MSKKSLEKLKVQYKNVLLYNQVREIARLKNALKQTGAPNLEEFFLEAEEWARTERLKNQYKTALLSEKKSKKAMLPSLEEEMKKASIPDSFFVETQQWLEKTLELGKEAVTLAETGVKRDDIPFEELSQKAEKLGGLAKVYVCALFDNTVRKYELSHSPVANQSAEKVPTPKKQPAPAKSASKAKVQPGTPPPKRRPSSAASKKSLLASPMGWDPEKVAMPPEARFRATRFFQQLSSAQIHPNSIPGLKPAKHWKILFDETGECFSKAMIAAGMGKKEKGRIVALLVPDYSDLKGCETGLHCAMQPPSVIMPVIREVCKSQCGVIGIPVEGLPTTQTEQWIVGVETLLDLILRLLPVDGQTELEILVEQRFKFSPETSFLLEKSCQDSLNHFARAFPEQKSKFIVIQSKFIKKTDSPFNGYVDAIANAWFKGGPLLRDTGWKDTCLISSSPKLLTTCIDMMEREDPLSPEYWNDLLDSQSSGPANSLCKAILRILGERARNDVALWERYLKFTTSRLNSKDIEIGELTRRISWLKAWQPDEAQLPPKIRLLWLAIKLAEENHKGITKSYPKYRKEFKTLSERLYREDAPLTCFAALHLAVSYTNEFDFATARELLLPWQDRAVEIPGLQYYGQMLSSLGQHEAFMGDNEAAIGYFRKAIAAFEMLSDPEQANDDAQKTRCYYLTSLMDLLPGSRADFQTEMTKYLGKTVNAAAGELSVSAGEPYRHHLLLRYLAAHPEEQTARENYLAHAAEWKADWNHPWELIEFYRALLCPEEKEKVGHLRQAYAIALAGGETMQLIAAVILGSLLLYDNSVEKEFDELTESVILALPKAKNHTRFLQEQKTARRPPLELAKAVLPFNFR